MIDREGHCLLLADKVYYQMASTGPVVLETSVKFRFKDRPLEIFLHLTGWCDLNCIWKDFKGKIVKLYICLTIWPQLPKFCFYLGVLQRTREVLENFRLS